jgi:hypothetical protein
VRFSYNLFAWEEVEVTAAGNRVFDMYNNMVEMELQPIEIDIDTA